MRKTKQITALLLAGLMLTLTACGSSTSDSNTGTDSADSAESGTAAGSGEQGKVLRIYSWNEEFKDYFDEYYTPKLPEGVEVEFVITPNEGNGYQDKLDADIVNNVGADNPIDIFLTEADYAIKYVNSDYVLDIKKDIGLTDEELSDQYEYTQKIGSDTGGVLRGVAWQATPGLFAYRRSIAKDVLGTDDPKEVQAALADWDKFDAVAEKAAAKGYKMLSGFDDSYRTFSNNVSASWVDADNKIVIDPNIMRWVEQTKDYTDKGYNNKTSLWAPEWSADQGPAGKVFGFFYSTWGINFTLLENSLADASGEKKVGNGAYGDYAVCEGPQNYYWGGCQIHGAVGSDNIDLVHDVMYDFTCNAEFMKTLTLDYLDYTNNKTAMGELANDPNYGSDFLGGQNHIALFAEAAPGIDPQFMGPYDQGLNESFQGAMVDYFNGTVDLDKALANFYSSAIEKYPALHE
ncbi:carbohydrate ABC transporter substrate-binding protein [Lachnospiraceae bacterium ZAX-1]